MKFELKKVDHIPACCQIPRDRDAASQFCRDEDYPGVSFRLEKWPTCIGETEVAVYRPVDSDAILPVFLYVHGGGWCTMSLKFLDDFCRKVVQNTGICVISPEYHLAPENPFPGLLYECYDVANYVRDHAKELCVDPDRIAVGGDSAGGNLAAAMCILAVNEGKDLFKAHLLYYPGTDLTLRDIDRRSPDPSPRDMEGFGEYAAWAYAGDHDRTDPLISPVYITGETAKKMPRLMIVTSYLDGLCEEGERYAARLQQNGVEVTMRRQIHGTHGTLNRKNWGYEDTLKLTYRYLKWIF